MQQRAVALMSLTDKAATRVDIDARYEAELDPEKFISIGRIIGGVLQGSTIWRGTGAIPHPEVDTTAMAGALAYTGTLEITTERGTLTALNVGVFEPKSFGTVSGTHRIIAGTGIFEGATGDFFWYGQATNEAGTTFVKSLKGEIRLRTAPDEMA
jgi:hypothetical protein